MMTPPQKEKKLLLFNTEKRLPASYLRSRLLCIVILQPLSCETNPNLLYIEREKNVDGLFLLHVRYGLYEFYCLK